MTTNRVQGLKPQVTSARSFVEGFCFHCITGVLAVIAHYSVMYLLMLAGTPPLLATSGGFVLGAVTRFTLARKIVFAATRSVTESGWRFILALCAQLLLNTTALGLLLSAEITVWVAQVVTTVAQTFLNYLAYRYWVFR